MPGSHGQIEGLGGTGSAMLVGRDAERAHIRDALEHLSAGGAHTLFIEGEPGIGKTRLIEELRDEARTRGFGVLDGRADELEQRRLAGAVIDALAHAMPDGPKAKTVDGVVDEAVDVIEGAGVNGPIVLLLEDLHWADDGTISVMRTVGRRLSYLPILMVGTLRPHPQPQTLGRLIDASVREGATMLHLRPLPEADVIELACGLLGADVGSGLMRIIATAAGNPLFVTELIESLRQEGVITMADGLADTTVRTLPGSLRVTILRRLSFLPAATLETLRYAAVLGSAFSIHDLAAVTGQMVRMLLDALDPAIRSKVLGESGDLLLFRHDLIREAIYEDLAEPVRASLHLEAAKALRSVGVGADRLAEHLLRSPSSAGREVGALLEETANALDTSAPRLANTLYERAIEVSGDDPRVDSTRIRLLWSLAEIGRGTEAVAMADRLLETPRDPATEIRVRLGRIRALQRAGRGAETLPELLEIVDDLRYPQEQRVVARAHLAGSYFASLRPDLARQVGEQLLDDATATSDRDVLAYSHYFTGVSAWVQGDYRAAVRHLSAAKDLDAHRRLRLGTSGYVGHAISLIAIDQLGEAARTLEEGRKRERDVGGMEALGSFAHTAATIKWLQGSWDDARAEALTGIELVDEQGGSANGLFGSTTVLSMVALHRGDGGEARRWVDYALAVLHERGPGPGIEGIFWCQALCLAQAGDTAQALETLWDAWQMTEPVRYTPSWCLIAPDLIHLARAAGDEVRARSVVAAAEEGARRAGGVAPAEASVLRCRGLVDDDADTLLASVETYRGSERAFELALVSGEAAECLARHDRIAEARLLFEEALVAFEEMGASHDIVRASASMRAAGMRRGSKGKRARPVTGWDALTPSEIAVARRAAAGMTNPQIAEQLVVSKYTVMTHLRHAFAKLQISSRVELAALVARHGETPPKT